MKIRAGLVRVPLFWIVDERLSRVYMFDIASQSEQKLRSKRRSKIIKMYDN